MGLLQETSAPDMDHLLTATGLSEAKVPVRTPDVIRAWPYSSDIREPEEQQPAGAKPLLVSSKSAFEPVKHTIYINRKGPVIIPFGH